ncbi:MAG TPA: alginate export family protein [Puia sp.]|nr:alginate export family protein [Puia sp.]
MMKKRDFIVAFVSLLVLGRPLGGHAQFSLTGQLRTRTELRDGYGTLETKGNTPAFLTSQRARLNFSYRSSRVVFQASLQDVRVWGADASTINNADGNRLSLHEAWADIILANAKDSALPKNAVDYFSIRIGRQELVYDDQRLLGNLDWLQQARRHDAVVFKLLHKGWQADLGAAFNQNTDAVGYNGTYYTPGNLLPYVKDSKGNLAPTPAAMIPLANAAGLSARTGSPVLATAAGTNGMNQDYKSMQFLYLAKKFGSTRIAGLAFSDEFARYSLDSVKNIAGTDTGYIYGRRFNHSGVNTRVTAGALLTSRLGQKKDWTLQAGYYYQTGKSKDGVALGSYTTTLSLAFARQRFIWTAGWDYLKGGFDPLYGTPHKFWGSMDYFYAASGSPAAGLNNPFLKAKYSSQGGRFLVELAYHYFAFADDQQDAKGDPLSKYLGSEVDVTLDYSLNKITTLELGASRMAATHSMEYAKGITPGAARLNAGWVYLQVNIRPDFFNK